MKLEKPKQLLAEYDFTGCNTFGLTCVARYFIEVASLQELRQAAAFARRENIALMVLGGGSNIIVPDYIDAVVVVMGIKHRRITPLNDNSSELFVGAGEDWHQTVCFSLENKLYGIENLALIPGTVGGAPVQNIGAYGCEVGDVMTAVAVYDPDTDQSYEMSVQDCQLGYRDSVFKGVMSHLIITGVRLKLSTCDKPAYNYHALEQYIKQHAVSEVGANDVFAAVVAVRQSKLPDPAVLPNVGSFFKNPVVSAQQFAALKERYCALVAYPLHSGDFKLAAGWLIDQAGWRGRSLGPVAMHKDQALVMVNNGGASVQDVKTLSENVQLDCFERYGITLETEPRWL